MVRVEGEGSSISRDGSGWLAPPLPERRAAEGDGSGGGDDGGFTLVGKDDAVEALAYHIAQFISQFPEAHALTPQQLQAALVCTLQVCVRGCMYEFVRACMHVCMCTCVCVHVCMCT